MRGARWGARLHSLVVAQLLEGRRFGGNCAIQSSLLSPTHSIADGVQGAVVWGKGPQCNLGHCNSAGSGSQGWGMGGMWGGRGSRRGDVRDGCDKARWWREINNAREQSSRGCQAGARTCAGLTPCAHALQHPFPRSSPPHSILYSAGPGLQGLYTTSSVTQRCEPDAGAGGACSPGPCPLGSLAAMISTIGQLRGPGSPAAAVGAAEKGTWAAGPQATQSTRSHPLQAQRRGLGPGAGVLPLPAAGFQSTLDGCHSMLP